MSLRTQIFFFYLLILSLVFTFFVNDYLTLKYKSTLNRVTVELQDELEEVANSLSVSLLAQDKKAYNLLIYNTIKQQKFTDLQLLSNNGETIFNASIESLEPKYKNRFIFDRLGFTSNAVDAVVLSQSKMIAKINANINKLYVYDLAWHESLEWLILISSLYASLLFFAFVVLYILFVPIKKITEYSIKMSNQEYGLIKNIPFASDLKEVATNLNKVSQKVKELFIEHNQLSTLLRANTYKDKVTNLANKGYYTLNLEKMLNSSEVGIGGAIIVLQLAHNRESEDLLKATADLLLDYAKEHKKIFLISHFGAGKFALIAQNISKVKVNSFCENLLKLFADKVLENKNSDLDFSIHIGATVYQTNTYAEDLIKKAEKALKIAQEKIEPGYSIYYHSVEEEVSLDYSNLKKHLKDVLENKDIVLQFQPVYYYEQNGTLLFHNEVFIRVKGTGKELILSGNFLPIAFSEHLGAEFDKLTIESVLSLIKDSPETMQRYGVNLSHQSLISEEFTLWLDKKLTEFGDSARKLTFEFMESVVKEHTFYAKKFINMCLQHNIQVGIDHFGIGFSSFDYLEDLNIAYIKVDGSYTKHINKSTENQAIIKSFVDIAHNRDILIFATNVEIKEERETLNNLMIDGLQGFLIGQPT